VAEAAVHCLPYLVPFPRARGRARLTVEKGASPILLAIARVREEHNKDSRVKIVQRLAFQSAVMDRTALVEMPEPSHSCPETNNEVAVVAGEILLQET